jgi:hypothetical protein
MKRLPISAQQARHILGVAGKLARSGGEVLRRAIPIVSAVAVAIREIRRNLK